MKSPTAINSKQLMGLLRLGKPENDRQGAGVGKARLEEMLHSLPPVLKGDHAGVLTRLERQYPDSLFSSDEFLVLSFIDDCISEILKQASIDPELGWLIWRFAPGVALVAIAKGPEKLFDPSTVFALMDKLCEYCIGWSNDLGILGELSIEKIEKLVAEVSFDPKIQKEQYKKLKDYIQDEYKRFADRENLFTRAELENLETGAARDQAARIINQEMEGQRFPFFIIILLQGEWLDFLQSVLIEKGPKSKEWRAAQKLTRSLVWSLKDHSKDSAAGQSKLRKIINDLPSGIRALDKRMSIENSRAGNAIADVEAEYEAILEGNPSERGDYTPIEIQGLFSTEDNSVSLSGDYKIDVKPGEWFIYEELDQESSRLKLILSWHNKQLLFTNYNHKSAIPIGYADFCRNLASGKIRKLPASLPCNRIVRNYVGSLVQDQRQKKALASRRIEQKQKSAEKQVEKARKLVAASEPNIQELPLAERKAALLTELEAVNKIEAAQELQVTRKKQEKEQRLFDANETIQGIGPGAEIRLSSAPDQVIECKLLTKMSSIDRFIFVDGDGIKVAEHTGEELVKFFLADKLEILTKGEVFEDTLASVVRGLRKDRDKIFGEEETA